MDHTAPSRRVFRLVLAFLALQGGAAARAADTTFPATEQERAMHVLNRLGYGARPGDVERVLQEGVDAYVRRQLRPESIDDAAVAAALAPLDTLNRDSKHLLGEYYDDIKYFLKMQAQAGNAADMKMRYGVDLPDQAETPAADSPRSNLPNLTEIANFDAIRCIGEQQQAKLMRAVLSERQLQEVMVDFWFNHFNVDVRKDLCRVFVVAYERDTLRPHAFGSFRDLLGAVARSPAMLVYLDNNENSAPREIGKIERTLAGWYVNRKFGMNIAGMLPMKEGPNENYARELLELHTLGVDGGYTQQDVQEVGRCFSGWTFSPFSAKFKFDDNRHDDDEKMVLGQAIAAKQGMKDGEQVLDLLCRHPATAKFISRKLCQRFVSDDPPAALVDRTAAVFVRTDGDIRKVVEAILTSDEFFAPDAMKRKVKSPFEYAASAVRATGGAFTSRGWGVFGKLSYVEEGGVLLGNETKLSAAKTKTLNWHVHDMGQPLLACAAPTGYSENSAKWVSPAALIDRLNFAQALAGSDVKDVKADVKQLLPRGVDPRDSAAVVDALAAVILHAPLTEKSRATLLKSLATEAERKVDVAKAAALIIGSPEFQRR